jgi:hypothetical protein
MKTKRLILGIALLVGGNLVASANTTRYFSGNDCTGSVGLDLSNLARNRFGCENFATEGIYPNCDIYAGAILPIGANNSNAVQYTDINVQYDLNSTDLMTCEVYVATQSGTVYTSTAKSSSSIGHSSFDWNLSTNLPNSGLVIYQTTSQAIFCSLPSAYQASGGTCVGTGNDLLDGYAITTVGS